MALECPDRLTGGELHKGPPEGQSRLTPFGWVRALQKRFNFR
jgi:hypothetical protein